MDAQVTPSLVYTNKLKPHNDYGIKADGQGIGNTTITAYLPDSIITKNVMKGGPSSLYSTRPGNFFPVDWTDVRFVDQANGNYKLASNSAYRNAGTDGKDVGANIDLLNGYTAHAISGNWPLAYMSGGALFTRFNGTSSPIAIATSGGNITVTRGAQMLSFPGVTSITAIDSNVADTLHVSGSPTQPLVLTNGGGSDLLQVLSGSLSLASDVGKASQPWVMADWGVHVNAAATATFNSTEHLRSLSVDGTATLSAGGAKLLHLTDLQVTGKLNLTDNDLVWDYTTGSPIGAWAGSAYTGLTKLIKDGRAGGTWNGNGIITNQSNAQGALPLTTLGIAEASAALNLGVGATGTFSGQSVDTTAVLIKYTYSPDSNLSGLLDGDDYFNIDSGFSASATGFFRGDCNLDGRIDADDYFLLDSKLGRTTGPL